MHKANFGDILTRFFDLDEDLAALTFNYSIEVIGGGDRNRTDE